MMESPEFSDARRGLPSLDRLLSHPAVASLISLYGREHVTIQARRVVDELRERLAAGPPPEPEALAALPAAIAAAVEAALGGPLRRVLNATGIYLHTNLGRAPLPAAVARGLAPLLDAYCDLELDLATGRRGQRNGRVERLLTALCGAEAALAVNNNAAALVIALAALAKDREVVVSRGELVEIGGSFRIPEIMAAAGARLVDEGSGLLRPRTEPQLAGHPSLAELVEQGVDLACGSGDKLLGGPQAGLLVGRAALLARCRRHP